MNKWLWLGLGILVGLLAAGGLAFRQPYTLRGAEIEPAMPAPEIELPAANGDQFVLSQHKNEVVLIFFGYTHCPDVCPATLTEMKALLAQVGEKYQDGVRPVFVTVDPQRDTAERLNTYVSAFSPGIIGLTGTEEELQTVWSGYGVYREIDDSHSADNYLVTHTSRLYLVDKQGRLRLTYPFGTPVGDIVEDVRYLLKEG